MHWLCDIRLPALGHGVRKARNLVDALGVTLPDDAREDLRLLVSEVVTNAVRHGTPAGDEDAPPVRVRVGLTGARLRVEVHDRGPGFEHHPRGPLSELDSGWGVHFVDQLADRWGAGREQDHWVVWFELRLPDPPDERGSMAYGQRDGDERRGRTEPRNEPVGDLAQVAQAG